MNERAYIFLNLNHELRCLSEEEGVTFDQKFSKPIDYLRKIDRNTFYYKNRLNNQIMKTELRYSTALNKKVYQSPMALEILDFFIDRENTSKIYILGDNKNVEH